MIVKAGISIIIFKDNKVLIGKRKGSHGAGCWAFPGGHIEFGETFERCAKREAFEETGLEIECVEFRGGLDFFTTLDVLAEDKQYVTTYIVAKPIGGSLELKEPEKCEGWRWIDFCELRRFLSIEFLDHGCKTWIHVLRILSQEEELKLKGLVALTPLWRRLLNLM